MVFGWLRSRRRAPDYWSAIAPYQETVELTASPQAFERQFERLPGPIGVLFAAHGLFSEVRRDGFAGFFWSPAGVLAPEAHQAFIEIGLPRSAAEIAEAMRILSDPYPRVCEARRRIMQGIWDRTPETQALRTGLDERTRAFRKSLGLFGLFGMRGFARTANKYARRNGLNETRR
jgi:hypothetical protein